MDGEEYGLLGSTEWAEDHRADLVENAVVYLNMDGAGGGVDFSAASVPALDDVLVDIAKTVEDPHHGTVYANWQRSSGDRRPVPGRLGSGSDYTVFLDHLGIASADFGTSTPSGEYHSAYDDLHMMRNFLDPDYAYHAVAAAYAGTFALRMADSDVLPLVYSDYAREVVRHLREVDDAQVGDPVVDLGPAYDAARGWQVAAQRLRTRHGTREGTSGHAQRGVARPGTGIGPQGGTARPGVVQTHGYAPGFYTGYAAQPLSAIDDAVTEGDVATATKYRDLLIESMEQATEAAHRATG